MDLIIFLIKSNEYSVLLNRFSADASESRKKYKGKYKRSGVDSETNYDVWQRLIKLFKEDKPYLKSNLNLMMLSELLNVKAHVISEVINTNSGCNFYTFVNNFRHNHAKSLLEADSINRRKLSDIALSSGYASQSNFYSSFKRLEGKTPKSYKRDLLGIK